MSERGPTSRCDAAAPPAEDLRPLRGRARLDGFVELVAEVLDRLTRAGPHTGASGGTDAQSALPATSDLPAPAHDLLAYIEARWDPVVVPRRGGHKRQRPTRLMNRSGCITRLANGWASETGRSRAQARRCLCVLAGRGVIERTHVGAGRAWRLVGYTDGARRPYGYPVPTTTGKLTLDNFANRTVIASDGTNAQRG